MKHWSETDRSENLRQLRGRMVGVLGMARSGLALARLLADCGARVMLSDTRTREEIGDVSEVEMLNAVKLEFGTHSEALLAGDLICISPGIPLTVPILQEAARRGIPILGEIEVSSWRAEQPLIAVTGSNGKTTTTTLIGEILRRRYANTIVAGNIGVPLAAQVMENRSAERCVVEVSSFQLETTLAFRPNIALIMNISPNHLDRYPDYESYIAAKLRIWRNMGSDDIVIYNDDDALLRERVRDCRARLLKFSTQHPVKEGGWWAGDGVCTSLDGRRQQIGLPVRHLRGPHNLYNIVAAALVGVLNEVAPASIRAAVESFKGIEHRLEHVADRLGVSYFNDSKATTVASLTFALQSFDTPIILIAGGVDKGGDFASLRPLLKERCRAALLIGKAAPAIAAAWKRAVRIRRCETLAKAVHESTALAHRGDVVLMAPACSSFDMFRDYEDRGRQFKQLVHSLPARAE